jgi:hypothetical protein
MEANEESDTSLTSVWNTMKTKKLGLLVDTGAYDNIGGSDSAWFKQHLEDIKSLGMSPGVRDIPELAVSGVGKGAATTSKALTIPGAVLDSDGMAQQIVFDTPIVNGSPIPPLWGLQSLRKHRALIDCQGLKLHLLGAGDLRQTLPPGSRTFPLELSEGGHLILPIGEFDTLKKQQSTDAKKKTLSFAAHPDMVEDDPGKASLTSLSPQRGTMVTIGTQTDDSDQGDIGRRSASSSSQ